MMDLDLLITPKDVARVLRCSLPWVYKAAERGILPSVRIPCPGRGTRVKHLVRFEFTAIKEFIEEHKQATKKVI